MRTILFISHATPNDNAFAAWLSAKLELHGYSVWVDIHKLDPATDFWATIDATVRNNAFKFLFVATHESTSGKSDGVNKELAVADRVRKTIPNFIVPLRVDNVSFDGFPVEILRQNAIDFYNDWSSGLIKLLEYLEKQNTPKCQGALTSMENALKRWKDIKTSTTNYPIPQDDYYYSNLYPLVLPDYLYAYPVQDVEQSIKGKHYPYRKINDIILTLVCPTCINNFCATSVNYMKLDFTETIMSEVSVLVFGSEIKRPDKLCVNLLNWNVEECFYRKGMRRYKETTSQRNKFFFWSGVKSKRDPNSRLKALSGSFKGKNWHYGLSVYYTQQPYTGMIFRWHLIFSDSQGKTLPDAQQITARRSKGRLFFNKEWRDLLKTAVYYLADGAEHMQINICGHNKFLINRKPFIFISTTGYSEPMAEPQAAVKEFSDDGE